MNALGSRSVRGLVLVGGSALATGAAAHVAVPRVADLIDLTGLAGGRTASFSELLVALASAALVLGGGWFAVVAAAVLVEAVTEGRAAATRFTGCPPAWRGWLLGLCGAALVAGAAAPGYAAGQGAGGAGSSGLDGLPIPDRPAGTMPRHPGPSVPAQAPAGRATGRVVGRVVVRVGDSLWHIAERELPATASDARIDQLWRRIDAINSHVIGPDHDLIQPGQRLWLPPPSDSEENS